MRARVSKGACAAGTLLRSGVARARAQTSRRSCVLRAGDTVLARPAVRVILPQENAVETDPCGDWSR